MITVDLHTHSRPFHRPPETLAGFDPRWVRLTSAAARRRGLDAIAVTNHDYHRPEVAVTGRTIPGIEISSTHGHVLVVGPDPPRRTTPGDLSPHEAVELAHANDCVAVLAHPFRNSRLKETDAPFDAVELNGKHPELRERIVAIARERGVPLVGGSDAHFPFEVGRVRTCIDADAATPEAVVAAIRDGRVEPVVHEGPFDRALRGVYTRIHEWRGHAPDGGY